MPAIRGRLALKSVCIAIADRRTSAMGKPPLLTGAYFPTLFVQERTSTRTFVRTYHNSAQLIEINKIAYLYCTKTHVPHACPRIHVNMCISVHTNRRGAYPKAHWCLHTTEPAKRTKPHTCTYEQKLNLNKKCTLQQTNYFILKVPVFSHLGDDIRPQFET